MAAVFRAVRVSRLVRSISCRPCSCEVACSTSHSTPDIFIGDNCRSVQSFARRRHRKQAQLTEEYIDQHDETEIPSETAGESSHDQVRMRIPVDLDYRWVPAQTCKLEPLYWPSHWLQKFIISVHAAGLQLSGSGQPRGTSKNVSGS